MENKRLHLGFALYVKRKVRETCYMCLIWASLLGLKWSLSISEMAPAIA